MSARTLPVTRQWPNGAKPRCPAVRMLGDVAELGAVLHAHARFLSSVRLAFENRDLVASLSRSKQELEAANWGMD